jgi:hypothetical protein
MTECDNVTKGSSYGAKTELQGIRDVNQWDFSVTLEPPLPTVYLLYIISVWSFSSVFIHNWIPLIIW